MNKCTVLEVGISMSYDGALYCDGMMVNSNIHHTCLSRACLGLDADPFWNQPVSEPTAKAPANTSRQKHRATNRRLWPESTIAMVPFIYNIWKDFPLKSQYVWNGSRSFQKENVSIPLKFKSSSLIKEFALQK